MKIHPLTVGPIVGETTPKRVRVWGRGDTDIVDGLPRRCFGVLRYKNTRDDDWYAPIKFKMNPNFDMTGIAIVTGLESQKTYSYEMGYFFSDVELPDVRLTESDWSGASRGQFTTASDNVDTTATDAAAYPAVMAARDMATKGEGAYLSVFGVKDVDAAVARAEKAGVRTVARYEVDQNLTGDSKFKVFREAMLEEMYGMNFCLRQIEEK